MAITQVLNYETGYNSDSPIGDLSGGEYNLAMSFTTIGSISVPFIDVYVKKVNTISSDITMRLETNSGGLPSGTLVSVNATVGVAPTNTIYQWVRFTFPENIDLLASTLYHIKLTVPAGQATNNRYDWARQSSGNGYPTGEQSSQFNLGSWGVASGADCYFRVFDGVGSISASSISFNGTNQYSQVSAGIIDLTVPYTIETYIKLNSEITTGFYEFIHMENNTQKWSIRYKYDYNGGSRRLYFYTARWVLIGWIAFHTTSLGTSDWVHLAMVRSSSLIRIVVNGVHVGTDATITDNLDGTTTTNTQLVVGAGTTEGTTTHINYANTKMACLRIWSDVRTDAEILANKDTVITGTADNLVGSWYNGDEDHNDDSQSNNLTAFNSPSFVADFPFSLVPDISINYLKYYRRTRNPGDITGI